MASDFEGEFKSNGTMHANFAVTRNPEIPSCLVEVDFVTSPEGEEAIWNVARRKRIAKSIALGIDAWCGGKGAQSVSQKAASDRKEVEYK